jgi:integrase
MTRRSGQSGVVVKKGQTWHGRYYVDVPGQIERVRRSVPIGLVIEMTKPEAKRKLRSMLEQQGLNSAETFVQTVRPGRTFAEQAQWWQENVLIMRAASYQDVRGIYIKSHLLPYFGTTPVCLIGQQQGQEFVTHLTRKKLAPATIESITATLRAILGKDSRDWTLVLPKALDAEQRYFTQEEMRRIVEAAKGKWRPFFALLGETGLRFGEAAGLHVEDLDLAGGKVFVRRSIYRRIEKPTKSKAGVRVVDISNAVVQLLRTHLAGRTTGRVFVTKSGQPLTKDNVRHSLHLILDKLGIPKGGLHAFRHGRVSVLQANGVPPDLIKRWVGHSSTRVTSIYSHFSEEYRQNIAQRVGLFGSETVRVAA